MTRGLTIAIAAAALALLVPSPTAAQEPPGSTCATRAEALKNLSDKYSEAPIGMGVTNKGAVIEVLVSQDGVTWTIIITLPNGVSCMVASGESWEYETPPVGESGA